VAIVHVRVELHQHSTRQAGNRPHHRDRRHGDHPGRPSPALPLVPRRLEPSVRGSRRGQHLHQAHRIGTRRPREAWRRADRSPFVMVTGPTPWPPAGRSRVRCYSHSGVEPTRAEAERPQNERRPPRGPGLLGVPGWMDWVLDVVQAQHVQCSPIHVYYAAPQ